MPIRNNRKRSTAPSSKKTAEIKAALTQLSPSKPIPFESGKGFAYQVEREYLPFLAPDDNFAHLLLQSRLLSVTNNACIVTKKDYCAGTGFQTKDEDEIKNKKFNTWSESVNIKDEPITEINKQIFESHFTFGNTPIELVRFTFNNKKYFYIYVHNVLEWRLGKPEPDSGVSHFAIQSKLFMRQDGYVFTEDDYNSARVLPIYNPRHKDKSTSKYKKGFNWVRDENGTERTLIWYKNSISGFSNYGLPSNVASMIYQILEYKSARKNLDDLENNMVVSAVLALRGNLTQSEINRIGRDVIKSHTGDGKRGRVMVVGSEEGIEGSDLHNFSTQKEGSYKESDEAWTQKIIMSNQWDSILAGIISASTMGKGTGFLTKIMEVKRNTVIIPAQNDVVEKVWKIVLTLANEWLGLGVDVENLQIRNTLDISALTDVDITPAVKVNEVRQAKGLPEDASEKGNMYLGELGAEQKKGVYVKDEGKKKKKKDTRDKDSRLDDPENPDNV